MTSCLGATAAAAVAGTGAAGGSAGGRTGAAGGSAGGGTGAAGGSAGGSAAVGSAMLALACLPAPLGKRGMLLNQ